MLTTLIAVSSGHATINQYDIERDQKNVQLQIGVALQETGIDNDLTGQELLVLQESCSVSPKRKQSNEHMSYWSLLV